MYAGRLRPLTLVVAIIQHRKPRTLLRRVEDRVLIG
jgi:hypothetical protein